MPHKKLSSQILQKQPTPPNLSSHSQDKSPTQRASHLPKVLYSHDIFSAQHIGGISRYIFELFIRNENATIPLLYSENLYLNFYRKRPNFKGKFRIIRLLNEIKERLALRSGIFDIYHASYYKRIKIPQSTAFIITIHDMIHEIYATSYFKNDSKTSHLKRLNCLQADGIIAISNQTKSDLINIFNIQANKIRVIYQAHSLKKPRNATLTQNLPKDYILFVGGRGGYKNFANFAKAIALIHNLYPHIRAFCVGSEFSNDENALLESLKIKGIFTTHLAKECELYAIYHNAICFVFPSFYEGFGIPILEAFFAQTPTLLSDIAVFREIAKNAALYFNPHDEISIAESIIKILQNKALSRRKIALANKRLADFSWERTYKQTLDFYNKILEKRKIKDSAIIAKDSTKIAESSKSDSIKNAGIENDSAIVGDSIKTASIDRSDSIIFGDSAKIANGGGQNVESSVKYRIKSSVEFNGKPNAKSNAESCIESSIESSVTPTAKSHISLYARFYAKHSANTSLLRCA